MRYFIIIFFLFIIASCSGVTPDEKQSYPKNLEDTRKIKNGTISGNEAGFTLFGKDNDKDDSKGSGIGVNSFLWRASLDTISFMPIASADPFGGVIITDWYEDPATKGERFKANITILDNRLRADGIRVALFKQHLESSQWRDVNIARQSETDIENAILTRARDLRVKQTGK